MVKEKPPHHHHANADASNYAKTEDFVDEIKHIKDILKDHDTQHNFLPLKFHRHVKPPVQTPPRLLVEKEVVAGKAVAFSKTMVVRERVAMKRKETQKDQGINTIYETEDYECLRKYERAPPILMYK
ncbi:Aste57867_15001 [Aphanomyces stellatus]|uniref:Aste57867_15001 protein n=1 Tax=Aphanomyces stellatus TaxID=120398 RepID=A0A485L251_9STRA|nr:hypothetical protein As57867_014945 [Aphanomyces stellatus]VFT91815.1 Aste57867_15001 [Aphanomyces stellatus]